jgi:cell division septation protein DedD
MVAPITSPERRQAPRMVLETLAYINLDPGNGGMMLNISEGGLCFRAVVPVQKLATIHLRLSEPDLQIEADAELAWIDEGEKKGGLHFINLTDEDRETIRNWISRPAKPLVDDTRFAAGHAVVAPAHPFAEPNEKKMHGSLKALSLRTQARRALGGFSGGLATGLLVSALFGAGFLLYAQRREFGELLVDWGERLGAPSPRQAAATPTARPEPHAAAQAAAVPPPEAMPQRTAQPPESIHEGSKAKPSKLEPVKPSASPVIAKPAEYGSARSDVASPVAPSLPITVGMAESSPVAGSGMPAAPTDSAKSIEAPVVEAPIKPPAGGATSLLSERYFEVGKFKERWQANETTVRLTRSGFPAVVAQKGRLWTSAYYVLVGPYGSDREFDAALDGLVSRGFKPRTFEKGSRTLVLRSDLMLNGATIPCSTCTVRWESFGPASVVKFENEKSDVLKAYGELVRRRIWYDRDAFVYLRKASGPGVLVEIRLGGTNQALVFGDLPD